MAVFGPLVIGQGVVVDRTSIVIGRLRVRFRSNVTNKQNILILTLDINYIV